MEEWPEKKLLLKEKIRKHVWCSPKGMWETPQTYGRRYSGQMRLKFPGWLFGHQRKCYVWHKPNTPHHPRIPSPQ
jgi:hypothetical protein